MSDVKLIVRATGGLTVEVTAPVGMTLRAAAKRIAAEGLYVGRDGTEVNPDDPSFQGEWTYCPPSQVVAVQFRL